MALFQHSVITKHINTQDKKLIDQKWNEFATHFKNSEIQAQIRNLKEEQYQGEFLEDLFVKILGYTKAPQPNHNLITEQKNQNNSKKADGAVIIDGKIKAVIELKGTDTSDLSKIETQAFGYKNNQPECVYVLTSNFEKIRFYIDNAVDFVEFNLFTLQRKDFDLLYCCLAYENIKNNIPKHLKDESVSKESQITKQLYKDYSEFKRALYNNLVEKNPQIDKLLLFKKTQKLLDRFLFIFFAEDRQLVPTNLIRRINLEWENLKKARMQVSLYDRYKIYFEDLNKGANVTLPAFGKKTGDAITAEFEIFAYNGGLFQPDEVLDNVVIDDDILHKHSIILSDYDFESDVDVNILGHIFENSLNEIDEIKKEIARTVLSKEHAQTIVASMEHAPLADKTISKRKKDGVFYTPKYITKYIVENTVGKLCEEKKVALEIIDEEFAKGRRNRNKTTIQKLDKALHDYRDWLLQITICDPACGSGAFLNQALEFLIQEHKYIDELEAQLIGTSIGFPGAELHILENNIYGVDLNDESIEIAKLSLWLRTAQKGRKLNSLNNNIKCGNSLIDDVSVAGDKAFSWEKEFPEVFKEKNKFAFHITTSIHDSRTSQRMIDYKARERRFEGTKPEPEVFLMTKEEEELIAQTVAEITKEDKLNIAAFNLCRDHMHILLVCEEDEVPKIMQKIKAKTAREVNINRGKTIIAKKGDASTKGACSLDETNTCSLNKTRGEKQNSLWTQKYGCKPITSDDQFWNTLNYIEDNKAKHNLPNNPKLKGIIATFVKSREDCLKPEYKGGFDVIIGNPPYVQLQSSKELSESLINQKYLSFEKTSDLYCLFYEKGNQLLKNMGLLGFITSNKWLRANYGKSLRKYLIENTKPYLLVDLGAGIFESATVDSNILLFEKQKTKENQEFIALDLMKEKNVYDFTTFENKKVKISPKDDDIWTISNLDESKIKQKIEKVGTPLKEWDIKINRGILTGFNEAFIIDKATKNNLIQEDPKSVEILSPILRGRDINRYFADFADLWLINSHNGYKNNPRIEIENYPAIKKHLDNYWTEISKRGDKGVTPYNLRNCAYIDDFEKINLFYPDIAQKLSFTLIENFFTTNTGYFLRIENKFLLAVLNSNLINYYFKTISSQLGETGIRSFTIFIEQIPIPKTKSQQPFIEKADLMLTLNKDFQEKTNFFLSFIKGKFGESKLRNKLEKWYDLEFSDFLKELEKYRKTATAASREHAPLAISEQAEWMQFYNENKKKALELKSEIDKTDKEIDLMVYELYGLTEEEIKIVEGN
jgi:type I restriction-modification system DNA methylase subunit